ncbi:PID-CTERM protein-sorting domain-containing protein [Puia sp. P3]|uniref:PID-CTERM protein-sorting domain-containing protein n=1 Tax=Puia sp. P3 TaxID=3423952 RepID=UPI003D66E555
MKKALPFAITLLFVCPILTFTPARANDGGKGSPSVLHQDHGQSWLDKAWDDFLDLFRGHHDKGEDKDNGKGPGDKDKGDKDHKGPGHREGPGSGGNANDGNGNGNGNGQGGNGSGSGDGGSGGSGGGAGDGGSMPLPPTSGGGPSSGGSSPSAPIDGGISLLLAAGVGLGVKKFIPKRAPRDPK